MPNGHGHAPAAPAAHPAPAPAAPAAAPANHDPHPPAAPAPAAHPPTPMTWEAALQAILAAAATAAGALLGDWLPALIILTIAVGPLLHPRTRPLVMRFFTWLHGRGVDGAAMLDRMYGYGIPTRLKGWLWTAVVATVLGWVAQLSGTYVLGGEFHGNAVLLFTLATAIAGSIFVAALIQVAKTRQVPSHDDVRQALASPQGFDQFLRTFGQPSSPIPALVALFTGATVLAVAHGYYIAAAGEHSLAFRVYGAAIGLGTAIGAGIAFQVVIYAITKLSAMTFAFIARPAVAIGRAGIVAAIPGITPQNQDAVLGAATSFAELVGYAPYVLLIGALGLAHIALGLAFGVPVMLIASGLIMIVSIGLYLGHASGSRGLGTAFATIVGVVFVGTALWYGGGKGYWDTIWGLSPLRCLWYIFVVVVMVFVAYRIARRVHHHSWSLSGRSWVGLAVAALLIALLSPALLKPIWSAAHPAPPTPMEAHANERLQQALEHNTERTSEALARTIERTSDDAVPRTPDEARRERLQRAHRRLDDATTEAEARRIERRARQILGEDGGHGSRRRVATRSTCVTYTGPGPCHGACLDFVQNNPRQCR